MSYEGIKKDILMKLVEVEDNYRDQKERLAWLATSIYSAFSIVLIPWLIRKHFASLQEFLIAFLLGIVYIAILVFVSMHFKSRWIASVKGGTLREFLYSPEKIRGVTSFEESVKTNMKKKKEQRPIWRILLYTVLLMMIVTPVIYFLFFNKKENTDERIDRRYQSEVPSYAVLTVFFFAQMYFIWYKDLGIL